MRPRKIEIERQSRGTARRTSLAGFKILLGSMLVCGLVFVDYPSTIVRAKQIIGAAKSRIAKAVKKKKRPRTLKQAISKYGPGARTRVKPLFKKAGIKYPPEKVTLIALKNESILEVYAASGEPYRLITRYEIQAASGEAGPKLKQGDCQVPEGFYKIVAFNPNSRFHLSLRVNYPNSEDKKHARAEKRTNLGGDIMIHGSDCSIGCLAMGDEVIEELFTLAHDTGRSNIELLMAPCDLRTCKPDINFKKQPGWLPGLYARLKSRMADYPVSKSPREGELSSTSSRLKAK